MMDAIHSLTSVIIEFTYGTVTIFDDDIPFVYTEDEIKEMIFVNDYTLPYAIQQGYNL